MTLLKITDVVEPADYDGMWLNPATVSFVTLSGKQLTIWQIDDAPNSEHLELTFRSVTHAELFVQAISLHGTSGGVS